MLFLYQNDFFFENVLCNFKMFSVFQILTKVMTSFFFKKNQLFITALYIWLWFSEIKFLNGREKLFYDSFSELTIPSYLFLRVLTV